MGSAWQSSEQWPALPYHTSGIVEDSRREFQRTTANRRRRKPLTFRRCGGGSTCAGGENPRRLAHQRNSSVCGGEVSRLGSDAGLGIPSVYLCPARATSAVEGAGRVAVRHASQFVRVVPAHDQARRPRVCRPAGSAFAPRLALGLMALRSRCHHFRRTRRPHAHRGLLFAFAPPGTAGALRRHAAHRTPSDPFSTLYPPADSWSSPRDIS